MNEEQPRLILKEDCVNDFAFNAINLQITEFLDSY